ncbi:SecY-interacting protein [Gayadomonas joobiniege]|uniref:SecY-interacting protein n=1 Tax=Gayadomonas joobiniege TaxID=1234606 RepID=UPI0003669E76|nr:SecY-interacting protein [Gayadomonas joobiniege]
MQETIKDALKEFFNRARQTNQRQIDIDPDWLSPCLIDLDKGTWQPVWRDADLSNIETALALTLNDTVKQFYTSCYAPSLDASFKEHQLTLLQVWNDEDFEILQENIIGHLMMKKRLKQTATIFIASTSDDNFLISVKNTSGEVVLEPVGKEPVVVLADSLPEFINRLTPSAE